MTDVALRQWLVRCGSIPACFDISIIMLSSVVVAEEVRCKTRFCRPRD